MRIKPWKSWSGMTRGQTPNDHSGASSSQAGLEGGGGGGGLSASHSSLKGSPIAPKSTLATCGPAVHAFSKGSSDFLGSSEIPDTLDGRGGLAIGGEARCPNSPRSGVSGLFAIEGPGAELTWGCAADGPGDLEGLNTLWLNEGPLATGNTGFGGCCGAGWALGAGATGTSGLVSPPIGQTACISGATAGTVSDALGGNTCSSGLGGLKLLSLFSGVVSNPGTCAPGWPCCWMFCLEGGLVSGMFGQTKSWTLFAPSTSAIFWDWASCWACFVGWHCTVWLYVCVGTGIAGVKGGAYGGVVWGLDCVTGMSGVKGGAFGGVVWGLNCVTGVPGPGE